MGHATTIYGIVSAPNKDWIWEKNVEVIQSLPEDDPIFPFISRSMFNTSIGKDWDEHNMSFAANYKNLEFDSGIEAWVKRFEELLRKLMWTSVTSHVNTEISRNMIFEWTIDREHFKKWNENLWVPTDSWILSEHG